MRLMRGGVHNLVRAFVPAFRLLAVVVLAFVAAPLSAQTGRENLHVSLVAATDYRHYGLSQTDSNPALRVSVDYEHDTGFFAGGFLTNVEYAYESRRRRPRDLQLDAYAGYLWRNGGWTTSVSLSTYLYPDNERDYDYTQLVASTSFRERVFLTAAYSDDHLALGGPGYQYEVGTAWPVPGGLEVGATLGYVRTPDYFGIDWTYWDVGLSRVVGRFGLDLRYHETSLDFGGPLGEPGGDRWTLSVSYAIAPRGR